MSSGGQAGEPLAAQPRPRMNRLAIAALVVGIVGVGPVPIAPTAMVLGIVALRQIRARGERGRGLAIAGIVLGALWVLALLGYTVVSIVRLDGQQSRFARRELGQIVQAGPMRPNDQRVGDCIEKLSRPADFRTIVAVPCDDGHEAEIFATFDLGGGSSWPGDRGVERLARARCMPHFRDLPGSRGAGVGVLDLAALYPDRTRWESADAFVACAARFDGARAGAQLGLP